MTQAQKSLIKALERREIEIVFLKETNTLYNAKICKKQKAEAFSAFGLNLKIQDYTAPGIKWLRVKIEKAIQTPEAIEHMAEMLAQNLNNAIKLKMI